MQIFVKMDHSDLTTWLMDDGGNLNSRNELISSCFEITFTTRHFLSAEEQSEGAPQAMLNITSRISPACSIDVARVPLVYRMGRKRILFRSDLFI